MNELASWLWPIPIAVGAWLAGWLACDWRNGRHRRQERDTLQRLRARPIPPHPLYLTKCPLNSDKWFKEHWERSSRPTTAATLKTSADTDTAQGTSPPADIPLPPMTVDGLPLAVEDMSWARRSAFRVVDSPASTEET
jgi:hypothetical protein